MGETPMVDTPDIRTKKWKNTFFHFFSLISGVSALEILSMVDTPDIREKLWKNVFFHFFSLISGVSTIERISRVDTPDIRAGFLLFYSFIIKEEENGRFLLILYNMRPCGHKNEIYYFIFVATWSHI